MRKNRILIVEDDEAIARMIAMNLKVAGYDTRIFLDGLEAYEALPEDNNYDLALLDVMVPGMNGFELMPEVAKYDIPVIYVSARDDLNSKLTGLTGGAEDYITKPFEILELLVRVEKVLVRNHKIDSTIEVAGLVINADEHTVKKNGREISLKPMEFELLLVLVKNKNIAISREKLLSMVWGIEIAGETRTVDVHIGQLRKKLDLYDNIKTVSKLGYRFEDN